MSLEKLQQKRTTLIAQRDQLAANLNATAGAIAMCDELIAEQIVADAKPPRKNAKAPAGASA